MAANEVIEIGSGSSDDEYEERKTGKANGAVIHNDDDDAGDDLEIVEVKSDSENPRPSRETVLRKFPVSSSRSEIRKLQRNIKQSSISDFFGGGKQKLKNNESKESRNAESDNCVKEVADKNDSLKNNKKKDQDNAEEDSETSIEALEKFVSRWEEVNSSKDDNKIREKLWKYYYLAHSSYTHSRKFIHLMEGATRKLSVDNIYVVIKDILDSLKRYKDVPHGEKVQEEENLERQRISGEESMGEAGEASPVPEKSEEEKKRSSRLRKVEKKMKEIAGKIKELEKAEVDLDDENNSAYLVEERLKRQFSKLHDYYCKVAECSPATGRPIERKFRYQGSRWPEINKRISTWVNKNKEFPDYVDILNLVKKVTKQTSLPLRPETVRVQAQEIFRDVGKMLKERRESDDLYNIYAYADESDDPALKDEELNQQLVENESIAKEKLEKVFQEFVDKDAEAREAADKNIEKNKKGLIGENSGESNTNKEETGSEEKKENDSEVTKMIEDGVEDDEGDEEGDAGDDPEDAEDDLEVDGDEDDEDEYGEDCEDVVDEQVEEHEMQEHHLKYKDDDGDTTDDDLKDVLTSACVEEEEEFSEEDVPIIDNEEQGYHNTEDDDSEVVCLDDDDDDDDVDDDDHDDDHDDEVEQPTQVASSPLPKSTPVLSTLNNHSEKRKLDEDSSSVHKKLCIETP